MFPRSAFLSGNLGNLKISLMASVEVPIPGPQNYNPVFLFGGKGGEPYSKLHIHEPDIVRPP